MPKLTLSMIVKNEEKYLYDCLKSVNDFADEIVLVDTGSSDNTINIAKEFNVKVYNYSWIDDFSAARNFALGKSTGQWILYLDADERLSRKSINELKNIIKGNDLTGYRCTVKSVDEVNGNPNFMKYTRLFHNNPNIKFTGKIHEQIDDSLIENGYQISDTTVEIIHIGYNVADKDLKNKAVRNLKILKDEFEKNKSSYYAYQLANTYTTLENYDEANKYYKLSVNGNNLNKEYKAFAYLNLSGYEFRKNNLDNAIEYLDKGLKNDLSNPLLNLLASEIFFRINKIDESFKFCRIALNENNRILSGLAKSVLSIGLKNESIISKGIYYSLSSSNETEMKNFLSLLKNENNKLFEMVLKFVNNQKINETDKKDILNLITTGNIDMFLVLFERYEDKKVSLQILKRKYSSFKDNSKFLKTLGLLYLENRFLSEAEEMFEESLALNEKDPSSIFYLISVYMDENQYQKIPSLLVMAEKEFGHIPEFNSKFELLKQKLNTVFEN
ncbi:MAG: glycosyltransferase [Ignavibacteriaceae bacterium]